MTIIPYFTDAFDTLKKAQQIMNIYGIRHLPVLENKKVVGIISDRDIKMALSHSSKTIEELLVRDAHTPNPYTVDPETPLKKIAQEMAKMHYGSVLVMDGDNLVGIFTTVDACRVLAETI